MEKPKTISDNLWLILQSMESESKRGVIIRLKRPSELDNKLKEIGRIAESRSENRKNRIQTVKNSYKDVYNLLGMFVDKNKISEYNLFTTLGQAYATMSVQHIYELANEPYIEEIMDNQQVKLTE